MRKSSFSRPRRRVEKKLRHKRQPVELLELQVESLEARRLLTTILDLDLGTAVLDTFTFSDGDGDVIVLRLEGTAGTAEITSDDSVIGNGGDLDDGEEIQSIAITGASSDFVLSFAVDSTNAATADGNVIMGAVTADSIIRGIYTVADTTAASPPSDFRLTSFTGVAFSDGGGISVDQILNPGGTALELSQTLQAGRVINVRENMLGNVLMQSGAFGGTFSVGANVGNDFWGIRGPVLSTGIISVNGDVDADINIGGNFDGIATISGVVGGSWFVDGSVSAKARLQSNRWSFVDITGDFAGTMASTFGDLIINVGGSMKSTARVSSADVLDLDVAGSVLKGATLAALEVNNANVVGDFDGVFDAFVNLNLMVEGSMRNARIGSGAGAFIDVLGSVTDSQIAGEGLVRVDAVGGMRDSKVYSSTEFAIFFGGPLIRSTLTAGKGAQANVEGDIKWSSFEGDLGVVSLIATGDILETRASSGAANVSAFVFGGSIINSTLHSQLQSVNVIAGGNVTGSNIVSTEDEANVNVNGNLINTNVESRDMADVDVLGSISRSRIHSASDNVTVMVGLDLTNSEVSAAAQDVDLDVLGRMRRSNVFADAGAVSANVTGDVTGSTIMSHDGALITTGDRS